MSDSGGSFSQGVGQWIGAAEVYDGAGRFLGTGRDTRTVQADDGAGTVTVDVSFEGPFSMAGVYTIADRGSHRLYQGPFNYGFADVLGDGLITAHNYWSALGMNQRFFLMVLPDQTRQLSLALISRGEHLHHVVVGEYRRQVDPLDPTPPAAPPMDPAAIGDDPTAGRGESLLHRPGTWSGTLTVLDEHLNADGTTDYVETATTTDTGLRLGLTGIGLASDTAFDLHTSGTEAWTREGEVLGSFSISGGRGQSGSFLHHRDEVRVWRREVASLDGSMKAVVHLWFRGDKRIGAAHGTLAFEAH